MFFSKGEGKVFFFFFSARFSAIVFFMKRIYLRKIFSLNFSTFLLAKRKKKALKSLNRYKTVFGVDVPAHLVPFFPFRDNK